MDIVGMVTRLPTLIFGASRCDDSFADRLSYKYTVLMLVLFAIIVTNKQFGTKHIQSESDFSSRIIFKKKQDVLRLGSCSVHKEL
jgi:Innexin